MWIVKLYYKHYIKIFVMIIMLFAFSGYIMVSENLYHMHDFVVEDTLIRGTSLTNKYFTGRKAMDISKYEYISYFDQL